MIAGSDGKPMLSGVKVVDLTSVVFGPYATRILADLGAEVIKVEVPPGGDVYRYAGKPAVSKGMSPSFHALNGGKQSVLLDLKDAGEAAIMRALLAEADVFALNVRGKAAERLGLDYESVRAINPAIIYLHCVGFGQDGPYADLPAYDDVIQAATGTTSLLPRVDGNPQRRYLPTLVADKVSGLHAAYAVMAALVHRLRTGEGQRVEVPMFEAFTSFMLVEHLAGMTFDPPNGPPCYERQIEPHRQPFPTQDGYVSIAAYTDRDWLPLFTLLEDPGYLDHPDYQTVSGRYHQRGRLYQRVAELTPRFTTDEIVRRCAAANLPAQTARDMGEILDDAHLAATGFFRRIEHPSEGGVITTRPPVRFGAMPETDSRPAPLPDADGVAIRGGVTGRSDG